ncbi:MAG: hypothetical protein WC455_15155 [Dehalococcoidia bacterium]
MIRVFPRRTSMTPTDKLAFIGDPPLFRPPDMPVRVSVAFIWDKPEGERLARAWSQYYSDVQIGGPAYGDRGGEFIPGRFVKEGAVITSRGCIRSCGFCLVPSREGGAIRELPIRDGWNILDNNLLACSGKHLYRVFDMLARQPKAAIFSGGLDCRLLQSWHVELFHSTAVGSMFFACDTPGAIAHLRRCADLLRNFSREKKRCYVLIGWNGETLERAETRLKEVYALNFLPFAMLYRSSTENRRYSREWSALQKLWCRPAAYKAAMRVTQ